MDAQTRAVFTVALISAGTIYVLPTVVALARDTIGAGQIVALNLLLGWTGVAWLVSLILAFGPRRPGTARPHPTRPAPRPPQAPRRESIYRDGWYVLSSGPESSTWAVCEAGRWRIVYELGGRDRLVAPVQDDDVPTAVLTEALVARSER